MIRLLVSVRWSLMALTATVWALCGFLPVHAGVVYSVLQHGSWRVAYQSDLKSSPQGMVQQVRGDQSAPVLAPDGGRVAFEVQGSGIYVCTLGSKDPCRVIKAATGVPVRPAWNPVTGGLVFVNYTAGGDHEDSEILAGDPNTGETAAFLSQTGIQDYPDFAPDGRRLVYSVGSTVSLHRSGVQVVRQLWIMDIETGSARQLTTENAQDIEPDWAPSGREIAFASNRSGQFEIWAINPNGAELRQVTSGPGTKTWPAWSPDGKSIMFTRVTDGRQSLWIIDADGTGLRLFQPFGPDSPIEVRDADWR